MRLSSLVALLAALIAGPAVAQDGGASGLTELTTGDDTRGWEAVGRLDMGRGSFCTGALIAPDLVLTAAHCLFESLSGERVPVASMQFLAGWRNGRAEAYRGVRRAVAHPDYRFKGTHNVERIASDLALVELDRPIRSTRIHPFATAQALVRGQKVGVVSYAENRSEAPSLQEVCHVLERQAGAVMLSCSVDFGASGSPIFTFGPDGPQIASVVSAKAQADGQRVALASELGPALDVLRAALEPSVEPMGEHTVGTLDTGARAGTGAKFLRP